MTIPTHASSFHDVFRDVNSKYIVVLYLLIFCSVAYIINVNYLSGVPAYNVAIDGFFFTSSSKWIHESVLVMDLCYYIYIYIYICIISQESVSPIMCFMSVCSDLTVMIQRRRNADLLLNWPAFKCLNILCETCVAAIAAAPTADSVSEQDKSTNCAKRKRQVLPVCSALKYSLLDAGLADGPDDVLKYLPTLSVSSLPATDNILA